MNTEQVKVHGVNEYSKGCRCEMCRTAWREYMAKRRRRLGVKTRAEHLAGLRQTRRRAPAKSQSAYYPGKTENVTLSLTALGAEILAAVQRREGRSYGDIFERYLRENPQMKFDDTAAETAAA